MKFINKSYEQAYTKSSNDNTCKIKQNNNKGNAKRGVSPRLKI